MKASPKIRLIIMSHPDDPELACGGTIAQWAEKDTVNYIIVSSGEKGTWSKDVSPFMIAQRREDEAKKSARFLGVKKTIFLRHPDGLTDSSETLALELAALIRHIKPHTIVTHDLWYRQFHPDHRATASRVITAIMIARDWHFYPFLSEIGLTPHRPQQLLMTPTDSPTFVNDITNTFMKKIQAIRIHRSQLKQLPNWKKRITQQAERDGGLYNYKYGEGFYLMRI